MAEGLARKILGVDAEIESAGSEPSKVNPFAIEAMKEVGIDISKHFSKSADDLNPKFVVGLDYVITLCAEEVCPVILSKAEKLHWPMPDPAGREGTDQERLKYFREVRDGIQRKLNEFRDGLWASRG
jgi:arsenate reductase